MTLEATRPTIPVEEYPRRWARIQALLAERDLDLLVAYADDRATFGAAHARWLADFPVHFEPACILVPREGPPVMLVGPESDEYARLRGRIADVRVLRELTHPDEDYPYSASSRVWARSSTDLGLDLRSLRRVGLAGRGLIGADTLRAFEAALPGVEWLDVENAVCDLRAVKSAAEVAVIREAYRIADLGIEAAVDGHPPGCDGAWRGCRDRGRHAPRRCGGDGHRHHRGLRPEHAPHPGALHLSPHRDGRHGAAHRRATLRGLPRGHRSPRARGRPGSRVRDALEVAIRAQEACARLLRPGIEGRAVEAEGRRIVADAGLGEAFLYSGLHSVGVIEFEPPIFGPSSPAMLQPGMVISIDIPMFNTDWGGLRVESGYLVTESGAERLDRAPYLIQR